MVYVDRAPFSFADAYVLDILRVAPIPVRPVRHHVSSSLHLAIVPVSSGRSIGHGVCSVAGLGRAVDFLTGHDDPGDPRRLVGHGDWSDESPRILRKPYRKADLAEMLFEVMEQ